MLDNSEFRILIVDDEQFNIEVVMGFLEDEGYQFNYTTNGKDTLKAVFSNNFDLILLDINMPEMDGLEVCRRIKNDEKSKDIPIIFLSAFNDIDTITKAFSVGGSDYITKPFNGLELIARVHTQIQIRKYIRELKDKQEKLAQLASTDMQTGLPNRLRFSSVLKKELSKVTTNPTRLSLAYIKIDHLQKINNLLGYKNTDKVLVKFAKTLQENIQKKHMATRLFSADFIILMPETSLELATHQIKKIYETIKELKLTNISLTCSIGITEHIKDETSDAFILRAEKIMESVKDNGGNRIATQALN
jgi:diguanylate cyclase (GGDEF)-like protein